MLPSGLRAVTAFSADLLKNGTVWIRVTDQDDANNCGYYAVPIKFKDTGIESELNLPAPQTGNAYVFLKKEAAGLPPRALALGGGCSDREKSD